MSADTRLAAWSDLWRAAQTGEHYRDWQRMCRTRRHLAAELPPAVFPSSARIALLGAATTDMLREPLQLALEAVGVGSTVHTPDYNSYAREMLEPASATVAFAPDIAVVVSTPANLPNRPAWQASAQEVDALVDEVCSYWFGLCHSLHERTPCDIVLDNYHLLPLRPLGAAGSRAPGETNRFLTVLNEALARRAPHYVHIHDVATLAALNGVYRWLDQRLWYLAKQPVSFDCLVPYVRSLASLIGALRGRSAKCVVVDLDNTVWGGMVGDDGADHLIIGEGDAQGEAYAAFQHYLLQLKQRGVMLAVSSKNDEAAALTPFAIRTEMVLRRDDFAAFHANWRPKSENLREIAAELNIGLDALVFVDDNPAEREQVRQALPQVRVVELGTDPSHFATALDRTGWFDAAAISTEDTARSAMIASNEQRAQLRSDTGDYTAYLVSLEQRAVVGPFEERYLDRIAQLTNKTNQFNLTTRRVNRSELAVWMTSPRDLTACVRLADRFGDNGLISVLAAHGVGADLWIDLWLMSCRVFRRGVEQLLCNHLVAHARAAGFRMVHGIYRPTPRNAMVRDHYATMGFTMIGPFEDGEHWIIDVERYTPFDTTIRQVADYRPGIGTAEDE